MNITSEPSPARRIKLNGMAKLYDTLPREMQNQLNTDLAYCDVTPGLEDL